jgi:hypothetical protein
MTVRGPRGAFYAEAGAVVYDKRKMDEFINSVLSNIEYDLLKKVVLALIGATGLDIIFSYILKRVNTTPQHIIFWLTSFILILMTAAFVQPQPRPNLKVLDSMIITVDRPPEGLTTPSPGVAQAIIIMGISNSGNMPSIATSFALSVKVNGATYTGERYGIPDTINFSAQGRQATYYGSDSLYEKGLTTIPVG